MPRKKTLFAVKTTGKLQCERSDKPDLACAHRNTQQIRSGILSDHILCATAETIPGTRSKNGHLRLARSSLCTQARAHTIPFHIVASFDSNRPDMER
ncbi:hypothetical protein Tco_0214416 [Tanacetum coccineum]